MEGGLKANVVQPGSNVDLGLMRALAIMQEWKQWSANADIEPRIKNIALRVYSASYSVSPGNLPQHGFNPTEKTKSDEFDRLSRRIEVRFTRLKSF